MEEVMFLDATAQAALIRSGEISPAELVEQTIRRIEKLNPVLNAVVIPLFEKAHAEARTAPDGPFGGVPYLLKDLTLVSKGDLTCQSIAGVEAASYRAPPPARPFVAEVGAPAGRLRIGVLAADPTGRATVDPDCKAGALAVADALADVGQNVADRFPPALAAGGFPQMFMLTMSAKRGLEL